MNFEEMKQALLQRLQSLGFNLPVYDEYPDQNWQKPALLLHLVSSKQVKEVNGRYRYPTLFRIEYYPDPADRNSPLGYHAMAERLYEELETIEREGTKYRGYDLHHEIAEDSLRFYISFDIRMMKQKPPAVKMMHLEQEERYK
ncbi:hypothetical protein GCM10023310_50580 [Paenibacillus vulneris]|uniref:DUF6838 family protein n=1 Tax=Paenibacillus vulneris TaxID=1133364 RepID=A0ABW3UK26_9BACL